eukprot:6086763-Alexandrium_andersonii.AAC.1
MDQEFSATHSTGGLMGNPAVVLAFAHTYKSSVAAWQQKQQEWDSCYRHLWARHPFTGRRVDVSLT